MVVNNYINKAQGQFEHEGNLTMYKASCIMSLLHIQLIFHEEK